MLKSIELEAELCTKEGLFKLSASLRICGDYYALIHDYKKLPIKFLPKYRISKIEDAISEFEEFAIDVQEDLLKEFKNGN